MSEDAKNQRVFGDVTADILCACTTCSGSIKLDAEHDILCAKVPEVPDCVLLKLFKAAKDESKKQKTDIANKYDFGWIINHRGIPGKLE